MVFGKGRCLGKDGVWAFSLPVRVRRRTTQLKLHESQVHCGRTEGCVVHVQQFMLRVSNTGGRFVAHSWSARVPVRHVDHCGIRGCE